MHLLVWRGIGAFRAEVARVELAHGRLGARGTQIGVEPVAYRLDYELETGERFVTSRLGVDVTGEGWARGIDLRRSGDGSWRCDAQAEGEIDLPPPGGDMATVEGCLDCDLGLCPLTNTMPVLRSGLLEREAAEDFRMAWVSVPDLGVHLSEQRYEHVRTTPEGAVVRYVGKHRDFVGELEFDREGFVIRYPELAERVG